MLYHQTTLPVVSLKDWFQELVRLHYAEREDSCEGIFSEMRKHPEFQQWVNNRRLYDILRDAQYDMFIQQETAILYFLLRGRWVVYDERILQQLLHSTVYYSHILQDPDLYGIVLKGCWCNRDLNFQWKLLESLFRVGHAFHSLLFRENWDVETFLQQELEEKYHIITTPSLSLLLEDALIDICQDLQQVSYGRYSASQGRQEDFIYRFREWYAETEYDIIQTLEENSIVLPNLELDPKPYLDCITGFLLQAILTELERNARVPTFRNLHFHCIKEYLQWLY